MKITCSLIATMDVLCTMYFSLTFHVTLLYLGRTTGEYLVEVAASDGAYQAQTTVTIDVLDVNDNAPQFTQNQYTYVSRSFTCHEPCLVFIHVFCSSSHETTSLPLKRARSSFGVDPVLGLTRPMLYTLCVTPSPHCWSRYYTPPPL